MATGRQEDHPREIPDAAMYAQLVTELRPGVVLATDVADDSGQVLLRAGTELTPGYIERLEARGVVSVQVRDGLADDVAPRDIVSVPLRAAAASQLSTVFTGVAMAGRVDETDRPTDVDDTVRRLGTDPLVLDAPTAEAVEALFGIVERLLSEVCDAGTEASLESLKTHSGYTYQHSVDVAAVGTLLGYRAGMSRLELKELALGCLVHDLGKVYIDTAILDSPRALTAAEREEINKHPFLGFELVRRLPLATIFPAHVAYQHHERQDATGYPRGLRGSNRMIRTSAERFDPRRMLLVAEIAAVADVYSALTADRPYRRALAHDVAADLIDDMSGSHLNREVVALFHRTFPRFPVGHWVMVTEGRHARCRGVVTAVPAHRPDRPTVRLLVGPDGEAMASPEDVDTRADADTWLTLSHPPVRDRTEVLVG